MESKGNVKEWEKERKQWCKSKIKERKMKERWKDDWKIKRKEEGSQGSEVGKGESLWHMIRVFFFLNRRELKQIPKEPIQHLSLYTPVEGKFMYVHCSMWVSQYLSS